MKKPTKPAKIRAIPIQDKRAPVKIRAIPVVNEPAKPEIISLPVAHENRNKIVATRFDAIEYAALEKYAAADRRPVSTAVWMMVTDLLKAEGYLK